MIEVGITYQYYNTARYAMCFLQFAELISKYQDILILMDIV